MKISMLRHHAASFKNAIDGVSWVVKTEKHFRIHLVLSVMALMLCAILHVSYQELLIVVLLIVFGLSIEMINTSIEEATDAIDTKWRQDLKIAKDVAAGAMLIFSIGSLITGIIIFFPKIFELLS